MQIDMEQLQTQTSENLNARKQEILLRQAEERDEVHAINQVLHKRNMLDAADKKRTDFLKANGVEA
jgi:hypothetical protein